MKTPSEIQLGQLPANSKEKGQMHLSCTSATAKSRISGIIKASSAIQLGQQVATNFKSSEIRKAFSAIQLGRLVPLDLNKSSETLASSSSSSFEQKKVTYLEQEVSEWREKALKLDTEYAELCQQRDIEFKNRDDEIDCLKQVATRREKKDLDSIIRLENEVMQLRKEKGHLEENANISADKAKNARKKVAATSNENRKMLNDIAYLSLSLSLLKEKTCTKRCARCFESNINNKGLHEKISVLSMERDSAIEIKTQSTDRLESCLQTKEDEITRLKNVINRLVKRNRDQLHSRMKIVEELNRVSGNSVVNKESDNDGNNSKLYAGNKNNMGDSSEDSDVEVVRKFHYGEQVVDYEVKSICSYDEQHTAICDTNSCTCVYDDMARSRYYDTGISPDVPYVTRSHMMLEALYDSMGDDESSSSDDSDVVVVYTARLDQSVKQNL